MQWNLLLLILMGHCSFTTCQRHDYRFVKQHKNWSDAQMYCRNHYADLATINNMEDIKKIRGLIDNSDGAWIGLESNWNWSLSGIEFKKNETNWNENEPNNYDGNENCVCMDHKGKWIDVACTFPAYSVCYNGVNGTHHVIKEEKTWKQAQSYCRNHDADLISGLNQTSNQTILDDVEQTIKTTDEDRIHIGLFRDSWKWSDGSNSSFRYWDSEFKSSGDCVMTNSTGNWSFSECTNKKTFFCHDDNLILIQENKTWEEALDFCQEKHDDLVSIHNEDIQKWVQKRAEKADSPYVWLGLRYTCTLDFWFWVSDEPLCYQNWAPGNETRDCEMSGAMEKGGEHHWFSLSDAKRFNFICSRR